VDCRRRNRPFGIRALLLERSLMATNAVDKAVEGN